MEADPTDSVKQLLEHPHVAVTRAGGPGASSGLSKGQGARQTTSP